MLYYKINIIEELKKAGYNTTVIRRRRLINENSLTAIRRDKPISWSTLEKICDLLNCQPGDIIGSRQEEQQISIDEMNQEQNKKDQTEEEQEQNKQDQTEEEQEQDEQLKDDEENPTLNYYRLRTISLRNLYLDSLKNNADEEEINYLKHRYQEALFNYERHLNKRAIK